MAIGDERDGHGAELASLGVSEPLRRVTDNVLCDRDMLNHLRNVADYLAKSDFVPEQGYKGKPANVFVALICSMRANVDVFGWMQSTFVLHGKPGMETKLMLTLLARSGRVRGSMRYVLEHTGDQRSCTASVTDAMTGDVYQHTLTWSDVVKNGWHNNSHWKKDPELMMQYRAASRLMRLHYPDVLMGYYTREELAEIVPSQSSVSVVERLKAIGVDPSILQ